MQSGDHFVLLGGEEHIIESFRSDYGYEIENQYDFQISKKARSQSPRFSLLLGSRGQLQALGAISLCFVMNLSMYSRFGLKSRGCTQSRTRTPIQSQNCLRANQSTRNIKH